MNTGATLIGGRTDAQRPEAAEARAQEVLERPIRLASDGFADYPKVAK